MHAQLEQGPGGVATRQYVRHRPQDTVLYNIVEQHAPSFFQALGEQGASLPGFVRDEFDAYLRYGRLEYGFIRAKCQACRFEHLAAFSCKLRGFCPSCADAPMGSVVSLATAPRLRCAPRLVDQRAGDSEPGHIECGHRTRWPTAQSRRANRHHHLRAAIWECGQSQRPPPYPGARRCLHFRARQGPFSPRLGAPTRATTQTVGHGAGAHHLHLGARWRVGQGGRTSLFRLIA